MNFDFLVFPFPKCSYSKEQLGEQLIFIPKYVSNIKDERKTNFRSSTNSFFNKSLTISSPVSSQQTINKFQNFNSNSKSKIHISPFFSQKKNNENDYEGKLYDQNQRKINVKLNMTNDLQNFNKKNDEDQPQTPILTSSTKFSEENNQIKGELKKMINKNNNVLSDLAYNEQRKSFFIRSEQDFEEGVNDNWLSSPKKIINYRFKESQWYNPFKMNSPRMNPTKYYSNTIKQANNQKEIEKIDRLIPCLLLDLTPISDKILIYFHGNAEDIYLAFELLFAIHSYLRVIFFCLIIKNIFDYVKIRILAVEYPGYGLYKSHKPNSNLILEDAVAVYDYLIKKVGYKEKNVILLGRSIGSGPACYLAGIRNPGALIMMSSFLSLRSVVKDHVGSLHNILKERFNNYENIQKVKCPCFFIHGLQDKLISYQHSQKLFGVY